MKKRIFALALSVAMAASLAACGGSGKASGGGSAEFVPKNTINWMCTSSPGGGSDIFSRQITDILVAENLINGQTTVVTNKTDGSGEIGRNEVATTSGNKADYQLLTFNSGDLMPMVKNTKNRAANFKIIAIMAVDKQLLFNQSLNTTLARTINTSTTTLLVLLCIFFLGGDSIRSFSFAMILGVIYGTLSSLFIAAPLAYLILGGKIKKEDDVEEAAK